jgi:hypothetical protein
MKRLSLATPIIIVCVVLVAAYVRYHDRATVSEEPAKLISQAPSSNRLPAGADEPTPQVPNAKQQEPPPPPPPPFPGTPPVREPPPEPPRTLIGVSSEDLSEIGKYLPAGAKIYTYPVGRSNRAAAIISTDVDGDGKDEIVVVYNERVPTPEEGTLPLTLSILVRQRNALVVRASLNMNGGVLFDMNVEGSRTYLSVRDVTGDNRAEILVAPGTGASVGGWLEDLSLNGSTLHEIANIGGHFFRVRSRGISKPSTITARSNGEKETRIFEWDGQVFEQVTRPKTQ